MWYEPGRSNVTGPIELALPTFERGLDDVRLYLPEAGLVDAVNVALAVRKPLLLAGEPGVGKSTLAHHLALTLGLPPPLVFLTKSTSAAQDLFYTFDVVGRLHDAQMASAVDSMRYVSFGPLGQAIVNGRSSQSEISGLAPLMRNLSVVLIDEIDKAPREFSTDVVLELESLRFQIREIGVEISADPQWAPIIVITTNSERALPDILLRRCVFYTIPFPSEEHLFQILKARSFSSGIDSQRLRAALELFQRVRQSPRL